MLEPVAGAGLAQFARYTPSDEAAVVWWNRVVVVRRRARA